MIHVEAIHFNQIDVEPKYTLFEYFHLPFK